MGEVINRGGRGHKSENPSYCTDDTQREKADAFNKADGSARLLAATMLYFGRLAHEWRVSTEQAMRIVDGMQRAGLDDYRPMRKVA